MPPRTGFGGVIGEPGRRQPSLPQMLEDAVEPDVRAVAVLGRVREAEDEPRDLHAGEGRQRRVIGGACDGFVDELVGTAALATGLGPQCQSEVAVGEGVASIEAERAQCLDLRSQDRLVPTTARGRARGER